MIASLRSRTEISSLMSPRVSVVMPVFNGGAYLSTAIESVLAQTFGDRELVIVDDGSTDGSADVIARFAANEPRIRAFRKENSGISDTLNLGISEARGDWIARLDADDVMLPHRLERQVAFVSADSEIVAAGSYYDIIDAAGTRCATLRPLPRDRGELQRILDAREPLTFTHPTMIYRRHIAVALGGYRREYEPCEDTELFARMIAMSGVILIQPEVLTLYRVHDGAISQQQATEMFMKRHFVYHNFYRELDGHPPISYAEFLASRARLPAVRRLRFAREYASELLYRAYTSALVAHRPMRAASCLAGAAALRPWKALRRGWRAVAARFSPVPG
ncbi:MAG TPA: glycosyltransferase [Stellaceae bacterium]|nr:glycosyltransferase [Stellaceae bacterium]